MINDMIIALIDFLEKLVFNNWADNVLYHLQLLVTYSDNAMTYINPAVTSLRVITYFVPVQHLGAIAAILISITLFKVSISIYKVISPFSS